MSKSMRITFSIFCMALLGLFVWRVFHGEWTPVNWAMLGVAAVCCLLVFANFVFIFNLSYALCALLNGALLWFLFPSPGSSLLGGIAVLYGLRLFAFVWMRNHSESYSRKMDGIRQADTHMPLPAKISLWFTDIWLMTFHLMAVYFVALQPELTTGVLLGAAIMFAGLVLEAIADMQKQASKEKDLSRFIAHGVFTRMRHPNYLGEIFVQAGLIVAGVSVVSSFTELAMVTLSPAYIIILMVVESRRVDGVQLESYGEDAHYQAYRNQSGSLLPKLF